MTKIRDKKLILLGLAIIVIVLGLSFYLYGDKLSWLPAQIAKLTSISPFRAKILNQSHKSLYFKENEELTVWVEFKNTGKKTWKKGQVGLINTKSKFKTPYWNRNWAAKINKDIKPGRKIKLFFTIRAPKKPGSYKEKFDLYTKSQKIKGGGFVLSIKVVSHEMERLIEKSGLTSKGDIIRIGLYNTNQEIKLSSDGPFKIKVKNKSLASFNKNEIVSVRFKKGKYYLKGPKGWKKALSSYPKFIPKRGASYIQIVNFKARPSWNRALNDNRFRGVIEIRYNPKTKKTWVINQLPLEAYLLGVAETTSRSHPEFQKALAIIARTYAQYVLSLGGKHKNEFFHLNTTASDQVYKGYNFELRNPNFAQAVLSTCGKMVTYKGKVVVTPYFSRSDGRTRSHHEVWKGKRPWLVSRPDPACKGMTLLGHGVGLSGYGARKMAEAGKKYHQILKYYYKGIRIKNFYSSKITKSSKTLTSWIGVGPRSNVEPRVNIFDSKGKKLKSFLAYHKNFKGGVSMALGDVDGDGEPEIIVGAGKGGGPHLRVLEKNGKYTGWDVFAFDRNFRKGINVATGDVDGDGIDEIGVCQAQGGHAWCKVYKYNKQRTILFEKNVFGDTECGASIAFGDVDGDGKDEIIVGSGPKKFNSQIKVFELSGKEKPISIFPFHPGFSGGLEVAAGDIDRDGKDEIGVCQKASGEAWCKVYEYNWARTIRGEWRAYPQGIECGASIDLSDINGDGKDEVITSPGQGYKPQIRTFSSSGKALNYGFLAFDKKFKQGTNVACGTF